jgi:hypothetical protein
VKVTDLDWNVVLRKTTLKRMTDFDDVTFQEQSHFTKTEFLVILSNMQDQNGEDLQMVCAL